MIRISGALALLFAPTLALAEMPLAPDGKVDVAAVLSSFVAQEARRPDGSSGGFTGEIMGRPFVAEVSPTIKAERFTLTIRVAPPLEHETFLTAVLLTDIICQHHRPRQVPAKLEWQDRARWMGDGWQVPARCRPIEPAPEPALEPAIDPVSPG